MFNFLKLYVYILMNYILKFNKKRFNKKFLTDKNEKNNHISNYFDCFLFYSKINMIKNKLKYLKK
jgi:hypothetical protein